MKKFISIGLIILLSITFLSCGTSKIEAQSEHPFTVVDATYTNFVGEQPDLVRTAIKITTNNPLIQLDTVYFRNNATLLNREVSTEKAVFTGSFTTSNTPHDYILDSDPKQEFGNKPPAIVSKLLFELTDNEAVVSYFYKDKINYYRISAAKEIGLKD